MIYMMEKYGVDMAQKPPTDDQLRKLKALDPKFKMPQSYKEAAEMISEAEGMEK